MFDLIITYINFIILSIKFIVTFLAFRPPNPKGVRIKDKKEEINENNENNNINNNNIEILFSVPIKKENQNKNNENNNPNNNANKNINNHDNKENISAENNINNNINNNNNNNNNNENNNIKNNTNNNNNSNNNATNNNKKNIKTKLEYKPATNKYSDFELLFLENSDTKIRIPAFIFKPKDFYQFNCIIIYCHGNSGDIGTSFIECQILSRNLRCEVLSFEYPGYGLSNDLNNRNEKMSYVYIREVYRYIRDIMGYPPQNIIIYGFSLGTGIAFDLACDKNYPNGGVILQSPFLSITRIFYNFKKTYYFDIFNSCDKAKFCESTIYIIHGNKDKIVPYIHGRILAKLIPQKYLYGFYTVPDADHNDLIKFAKENLYINIGNFIYDMQHKKEPTIYDKFTDKDKDKDSSVMDLSSMKSDSKFHVSEKKGFKELPNKIEFNDNNISSKEKLNEEKNEINMNKSIKSVKSNKELKHELSCLFPKGNDDDTVIDDIAKVENKNDIKINVNLKNEKQEKK